MTKTIRIENPSIGKAEMIIGWLLVAGGAALSFTKEGIAVGIFMILFGFILVIIGKIKHWYHN